MATHAYLAKKQDKLPLLGISACLLGDNVRYDGVVRRDDWILGTLARHVELVPLCPEVAIGMGVPRPPIQLVQHAEGVGAVGVDDPCLDVTDELRGYGARMTDAHTSLCGYIFKARSPSCGLVGVNLYPSGNATPELQGTGLYAAEWQARRPEVPLEEEGGLGDADRRDAFLERVFALHRWRRAMDRGFTQQRLVAFHGAHRRLLLTRGSRDLRTLDRWLRVVGGPAPLSEDLATAYLRAFMALLARPASRTGHVGALRDALALLPKSLPRAAQTEVHAALAAYRAGNLPRLVPLTLIRHHLRLASVAEADDAYLNPEAGELALRGGV